MAQNTRRQYLREIDRLEPAIRRAYFAWVADRLGSITLLQAEQLVRSGDISQFISDGDFAESLGDFTEAVREAYKAGGAFEAPAAQVTFNIRSERAEQWIAQYSSQMVTRITESQREGIQAVLREGIEKGNNPRRTALDIIGRKGAGNRRRGGIIGLTKPQADAVVKARDELRSGDPAKLRSYLNRKRRDKRFDATVRKALEEGKPLSKKVTDKIAGRYSDKLLQLRGETIARTEATAALNAGRDEAWQQAYDNGSIDPTFVTSTWKTSVDGRERDAHREMHNQQRAYNEPFNSPTGAQLWHPGDTSLGAGAEDVANCRCFKQRQADFIGSAAANRQVA